jgi:hypothetical protein
MSLIGVDAADGTCPVRFDTYRFDTCSTTTM